MLTIKDKFVLTIKEISMLIINDTFMLTIKGYRSH